MSRKRHLTLRFAPMSKTDFDIFVKLICRQTLDPFDEAYAIGVEILAQVQRRDLFCSSDAVEIDVIDRQPSLILVDQRECRAADPCLLAHFDAFAETAYERGFPSSPRRPMISPPVTSLAKLRPKLMVVRAEVESTTQPVITAKPPDITTRF